MDGNHPKRRKDKYNPYKICESQGRYYLSFRDGEGVQHEMEINEALYRAFNQFELDDLSYMNKVDRHYERSEQTEASLNRRAMQPQTSVEDAVSQQLEIETLHSAIGKLSEKQRRRLVLYYFGGLTYAQIAQMEGCSCTSIVDSVRAAIANLKKIFLT